MVKVCQTCGGTEAAHGISEGWEAYGAIFRLHLGTSEKEEGPNPN